MSPIKAQRKPTVFELYAVSDLLSAPQLPEVFAKAQSEGRFRILGNGSVSVLGLKGVVSCSPGDYLDPQLIASRSFTDQGIWFEVIPAADFAANYEEVKS